MKRFGTVDKSQQFFLQSHKEMTKKDYKRLQKSHLHILKRCYNIAKSKINGSFKIKDYQQADKIIDKAGINLKSEEGKVS